MSEKKVIQNAAIIIPVHTEGQVIGKLAIIDVNERYGITRSSSI